MTLFTHAIGIAFDRSRKLFSRSTVRALNYLTDVRHPPLIAFAEDAVVDRMGEGENLWERQLAAPVIVAAANS